MTSRAMPIERIVGQGGGRLLLGLLLAPLLACSWRSSVAQAARRCACRKVDETGCVSGTIGTAAEPIAGVDVTLQAPDGSEETARRATDDGKCSFKVTSRRLFVRHRRDTFPRAWSSIPRRAGARRGSSR